MGFEGARKIGGGVAVADGVVVQGSRGRFKGSGELSQKQRAFVACYVANGGKRIPAATAAGYAHPRTDGTRLLGIPAVREAIRREHETAVCGELSCLAVNAFREILADSSANPSARITAGKFVLEAAGIGIASRALDVKTRDLSADKPIAELTLAELEDVMRLAAAKVEGLRSVSAPAIEAEAVEVDDGE